MNWAWASSLDPLWRSPTFPMWLTLAAAGFFGIIVLITLLRAEKSVANGALTVITLLAIGVAVAATLRGFGPGSAVASAETRASARYLRGGNAAWQAAGLPLSTAARMADEPLDYWPKPYERPGNTRDAMNEYLSWEVDLLPRIKRDGTTRFVS